MKRSTRTSKVYDCKEACEYMKISRSTLARLLREGEISHMKFERAVRFYEEDLLNFLDKRRIPAKA